MSVLTIVPPDTKESSPQRAMIQAMKDELNEVMKKHAEKLQALCRVQSFVDYKAEKGREQRIVCVVEINP